MKPTNEEEEEDIILDPDTFSIRLRTFHVFEKFPTNVTCPMCGTSEDRPCVLVPIADQDFSSEVLEAVPIHCTCIQDHWVWDQQRETLFTHAPKPKQKGPTGTP